jgi:hypothetical protein
LFVSFDQGPAEKRRYLYETKRRGGDFSDSYRFWIPLTDGEETLERAIGAQLLNGSEIATPDQEVVEQPSLPFTTAPRIAHLDFDDAVAFREWN